MLTLRNISLLWAVFSRKRPFVRVRKAKLFCLTVEAAQHLMRRPRGIMIENRHIPRIFPDRRNAYLGIFALFSAAFKMNVKEFQNLKGGLFRAGLGNSERMHRPGIEPGSVPWQGTILPLDHRCSSEMSSDIAAAPAGSRTRVLSLEG